MKKIFNRGGLNVSVMLALAITGCKNESTAPAPTPGGGPAYSTQINPLALNSARPEIAGSNMAQSNIARPDVAQSNVAGSPAYLDTAAPTTQMAIIATTQQATTMPANHILQTGTLAPTFTLHSNTGKEINLADYVGKQVVVLYFYPKADTPGCTTEACGFRDAIADYDKADIAVIGVSPDPVDAISLFTNKYSLNFPLLADLDHKICDEYGVWQQRGTPDKPRFGVARTTFIIGKDGNIAHVFESVQPAGHDQQVLQWIKDNKLVG
jgi:peroxiredoxin Q/BCP